MKSYRKFCRIICLVLFFIFGIETFLPIGVYALTSGPTTPEVQSFEPASTDQMVDLFTGDFNYNIPLFELPGPNGGYPFNLAYHSGIGMDQEASWVGLGWNINPGAINREVRGYADDWNEENVLTRQDIKNNWTVGVRGGVNLELFGADLDKGGVSLGMSVYYNSYKGMGYSLDMGVNYHGSGKKSTSGLGLNMSLDNQEGASLRPSLSLSDKKNDGDEYSTLSVSVGLNSKRGLTDVSFGLKAGSQKKASDAVNKRHNAGKTYGSKYDGGGVGNESRISFAATAYSPSIDMPMAGSNFSLTFKVGLAESGVLGSFYVGAYYSEQHIKDQNRTVSKKAYGYLNFQNAGKSDLTDYNREKDGMVRDETPNLAIPNATYDVYSILGQGTGGMFRPYRSSVTSFYDNFQSSVIGGGALGIEFGAGVSETPHLGIDASINVSKSKSGPWENYDHNNLRFDKNGVKDDDFAAFEQTYFKIAGETTTTPEGYYDYIGNSDLSLPSASGITNFSAVKKRIPRNSVVQPLTNAQLVAANSTTTDILPEYTVKYFTLSDITNYYKDINVANNGTKLDRKFGGSAMEDSRTKHIGAYSILQADGSRYIYGLPVYNTKEVDVVYSCNGQAYTKCIQEGPIPESAESAKKYHRATEATDQYLNWKQLPPYTTSHLLTGILGTDYVDVDNNGPSDNDFGYWVKFNYVKVADATAPYKWKAPFNGSNLMKGNEYRIQDDKASYNYGEKEIYNLATAETKTHIAVFILKPRKDGLGVSSEYQKTGTALGDKRLYRIQRIELYEKSNYFDATGQVSSNKKPITTVHFEYTYQLCKGIPNFSDISGDDGVTGTDNGKLTLKKLWFTNERSGRGGLSPYIFNYSDNNPNYNRLYQDRWGNYKNYGEDPICDAYEFPYVEQSGSSANQDATAWNLNSIRTPSGSTIKVDYESDDYSHVQNKVACQMFKIASVESTDDGLNNVLYDWNGDDPTRKVFFNLERPTNNANELKRYFNDLKTPEGYQLYFKAKVKLRRVSEPVEEFVSGYLPFQENNWGFDENSLNGDGNYTRGWLKLDEAKVKRGEVTKYNPISLAAWQYIKVNMPDECSTPGKLSTAPGSATQNLKDKALQLISAITSIRDLFTNYFNRCKRNSWASRLDLNNSWIRLNTPDRTKFGGGLRVSKITIEDSWDKDFENAANDTEYGVVYDYTTDFVDEDGTNVEVSTGVKAKMSSGVAAYEPIIGGDEIALRYAKMYSESVPLKTNNDMFFEFPINEGYFPGPLVGYSKVTVRSLASDRAAKAVTEYAGVPTTGQAVHEFYTAKDFPVEIDETDLAHNKDPFHLYIPLIFLGDIKIDNINAEQAYKIELNDMHGRPKRVGYYAQDVNGKMGENEISYIEYKYLCTDNVNINGKLAKRLRNNVNTLEEEGGDIVEKEMGVQYDYFTDLRHSYTRSGQGGVSINSEVLNFFVFVLPVFVPWPNISYTQAEAKLAVSNKVIHRTGILESTVAYDAGSKVTTNNLYYDGVSGRPVVTTVTNDYEAPIYKYNIPAHWVYTGMGPAYKNIGFTDEIDITSTVSNIGVYTATTNHPEMYQPGDEILLNYNDGTANKYSATVVNNRNGETDNLFLVINSSGIIPKANDYPSMIVRSGYRNQLTVDAGSVTALKDPTDRLPGSVDVMNITYPPVQILDVRVPNEEEEGGYSYMGFGQGGASFQTRMLKDVISTSAVTYSNSWGREMTDLENTFSNSDNGYRTGANGIWRGKNSYTYVIDRSKYNTDTKLLSGDINTSKDGVISSEVPMFPWAQSSMVNDLKEWRNINSVSKYDLYNHEIEVFDALHNYSAALYAYNGKLPVATSVNSKSSEISYEGFEEYNNNNIYPQSTSKANFSFFNTSINYIKSISLEFDTRCIYNLFSIENIPYSQTDIILENNYIGRKFRYDLVGYDGHIRSNTGVITGIGETLVSLTHILDERLLIADGPDPYMKYPLYWGSPNRLWSGKLYIEKQLPAYTASFADKIEFTNAQAHTGKISMKVMQESTFPQFDLKLEANKKYVFGAWTRTDFTNLFPPNQLDAMINSSGWGIQLGYGKVNGTITNVATFKPSGEAIDGWRRIETNFVTPATLEVDDVWFITVKPFQGEAITVPVYLDDLRIHPFDASFQSFVYNPNNFKLLATLDANNYATFYSYDSEGNLCLVRKETERGILSTQETKTNIKH